MRVTASNGSSVYASAVSGNAPRSYWRFGGGSGPLLDQQGVGDGTYVGSPQRAVPGLLVGDPDPAVGFNGTSQYADVPAAAAWTPPVFSIELSVRPSELPVNKTIWAAQGATTGWWLNTGPSGEVRLFVGDGSAWRFDDSGPVLNAGSTYHLAATYDGSNARLYVNGALVSTGPNVTMAPGSPNLMRFGAYSTGPGQYWPGTLDDASFYPAALTPTQVQGHYNASITGSQATSTQTGTVTSSATAPVNTTPPMITGMPQQGQTLAATTGSWTGTAPITYSYQWQRCSPGCTDINGATASSYTLLAADVGTTLRVAVTGSNSAGSSQATSTQTGTVTSSATAPVNTTPPTITGTPQQGQTLAATTGSWTGTAPITYSYQWQRCSPGCTDINGATASSYTLLAADVGTTLRVAVTGSNSAGSSQATSTQTGTVTSSATAPVNTTPPTITGTPQQGQTLAATMVRYWDRVSGWGLRWERRWCCLGGERRRRCVRCLRFRVWPQLGSTLTAKRGCGRGRPPLMFSYQWRRCNGAGGGVCGHRRRGRRRRIVVVAADVDSRLAGVR